ncbi:phage tail protein [Aliivibrio sp. EL58]|uniref:phage tail protein n=1 Tax=Aliivibrio sp. EL58 TaxID=2107582 RepID=UPI000EFB17FB|nr:phage tail protein [Aliivibrio sp. EL58]
MHHLVIGEFVFSVGDKTPIMKMNRVTIGRFTEISLVDGAMSSPTGKPLETLSITAKWLRQTAEDNVERLRQMVDEPQQVSNGGGVNLGQWTIKSINEGKSELVHNGSAQVTDVTLELLEYR